jgi:hypothetical protein
MTTLWSTGNHTLSILGTAAVLAGLTGGCGRQYRYRPTELELASVQGVAGARYQLPIEGSTGELRVASFGAYDLQPEAGGLPFSTVHARLVLANARGAGPWTIDVRELVVEIPGEGKTPPIYANASASSLPVVQVGPGATEVVDLYFPLPALPPRAAPRRFDLWWTVATEAQSFGGRTAFERAGKVAGGEGAGKGLGQGVSWWHDPYFPRVGVFTHQGPLFVSIPPQPHDLRVVPRGRRAALPAPR